MHRLDDEELIEPIAKSDMDRLAEAERLAHALFDLWRHGQGHLCHRITRGEFEQQEDHKADEQKRRDGKDQSSNGKGQHIRRLCKSV